LAFLLFTIISKYEKVTRKLNRIALRKRIGTTVFIENSNSVLSYSEAFKKLTDVCQVMKNLADFS